MQCIPFKSADGQASGLICRGRGRLKREPCFVRDCLRAGEVLCDWPMKAGPEKTITCDRRCCRIHAKSVGPDKDYCLEHALQARKQEGAIPR